MYKLEFSEDPEVSETDCLMISELKTENNIKARNKCNIPSVIKFIVCNKSSVVKRYKIIIKLTDYQTSKVGRTCSLFSCAKTPSPEGAPIFICRHLKYKKFFFVKYSTK